MTFSNPITGRKQAQDEFKAGAAWHQEAAALAGWGAGWSAAENHYGAQIEDLRHQLTLFARRQGMGDSEWENHPWKSL